MTRHIAEASTEWDRVALWDPSALPEDFDSRFQVEAAELLEELQAKERVLVRKSGEGDSLLHLYLDEPIPEHLAPYLKAPGRAVRLPVPSGQLWFAGADFMFRTDDAKLRRWPAMGTRLEVPPGIYRVRWSRVKVPDQVVEEQRRAILGERVYDRLQGDPGRFGICLALTLAAIGAFFLAGPSPSTWFLLAVAAGFWIAWLFSRRTPSYREAQRKMRELARETPSLIAELQRMAS